MKLYCTHPRIQSLGHTVSLFQNPLLLLYQLHRHLDHVGHGAGTDWLLLTGAPKYQVGTVNNNQSSPPSLPPPSTLLSFYSGEKIKYFMKIYCNLKLC